MKLHLQRNAEKNFLITLHLEHLEDAFVPSDLQ